MKKAISREKFLDQLPEYQTKVDKSQRIVVGVNKFKEKNEKIDIPILNINEETGRNQIEQLQILKKIEANQT